MLCYLWFCVCEYDLVNDLPWLGLFFLAIYICVCIWIWVLACPCHFIFQIKEVNVENVSKPICVSNTPLRNSDWCCVWYAQRHLSLIHLLRERDGGWSAPGITAASVRYDAAWFWSLTFAFSCIPKNKASLPLRNYSNDLQLCMFSCSFVVGIWEHILTSQLLMQGSE